MPRRYEREATFGSRISVTRPTRLGDRILKTTVMISAVSLESMASFEQLAGIASISASWSLLSIRWSFPLEHRQPVTRLGQSLPVLHICFWASSLHAIGSSNRFAIVAKETQRLNIYGSDSDISAMTLVLGTPCRSSGSKSRFTRRTCNQSDRPAVPLAVVQPASSQSSYCVSTPGTS